MKTLLVQFFGDGSTVDFDLPRALTSGFVLDVKMNGESLDFDYSDSNTVHLQDAPENGDLLELWESNEIVVAKEVHSATVSSPEQGGSMAGVQGGTAALAKTDAGTTVLLAAATFDRIVMIHVKITEDFELGTGTLPTHEIGQTSTLNKFMPVTALVDESNVPASPNIGKDLIFSGTLSATKELLITSTAAVGDSTGAIAVSAVAVPV